MDKEYYYLISNSIVKLSEELTIEDGYHLGTTYADSMQGVWTPLSDDQVIFYLDNPAASPREIFSMELDVRPEPIPIPESELIDRAKQEKIRQIIEYDRSDAVNTFTVNDVSAWLTPDIRANYRNSIEAAELLGETHITFIIAHIAAISALQDARMMLAKIQRYADKCTLVTETHKANISVLQTVEKIEAYDYITGYPEKESFTIVQIAQNLSQNNKEEATI